MDNKFILRYLQRVVPLLKWYLFIRKAAWIERQKMRQKYSVIVVRFFFLRCLCHSLSLCKRNEFVTKWNSGIPLWINGISVMLFERFHCFQCGLRRTIFKLQILHIFSLICKFAAIRYFLQRIFSLSVDLFQFRNLVERADQLNMYMLWKKGQQKEKHFA